jgi:hypothetical protein
VFLSSQLLRSLKRKNHSLKMALGKKKQGPILKKKKEKKKLKQE